MALVFRYFSKFAIRLLRFSFLRLPRPDDAGRGVQEDLSTTWGGADSGLAHAPPAQAITTGVREIRRLPASPGK